MTLLAARKAAAEALHEVAQGRNPVVARFEAKAKEAGAKADTVRVICDEFLQREGKKLRTLDQRISIFKRLVYPSLGNLPIASIKRSDIHRLMDKIEDNNGPRMADVTLAALRKVFNWHSIRSDTFNSPIVRGMARQTAEDRKRSRTLNDDELRAVWAASMAEDNQPFGALVRFLLLTAARRTEASHMSKSELDADYVWTLPAARSKNKKTVIRPLSKVARSLITEPTHGDYIFSVNAGITPVQAFSARKAQLDRASGVTGWRLHDLRRTARTLLPRAGISPDVAERCLGHSIGGVRGVYDHHRYLEEMRHAFEALAAQIERIVQSTPAKVIPIAKRRR